MSDFEKRGGWLLFNDVKKRPSALRIADISQIEGNFFELQSVKIHFCDSREVTEFFHNDEVAALGTFDSLMHAITGVAGTAPKGFERRGDWLLYDRGSGRAGAMRMSGIALVREGPELKPPLIHLYCSWGLHNRLRYTDDVLAVGGKEEMEQLMQILEVE